MRQEEEGQGQEEEGVLIWVVQVVAGSLRARR